MSDPKRTVPFLLALLIVIHLAVAPAILAAPRKQSLGFTSILAQGRIRGVVYHDWDANGLRDAHEPPMAGVLVLLEHESYGPVASTVTAADGSYDFRGLTTGTYFVTEQDSQGYCSTTPNRFAVDLDFALDVHVDFGDLLIIPGCFRSVGGQVFEDLDADGLRDEAEPPLANVQIMLTDEDGSAPAMRVTDQYGRYSFHNLEAGTYTLTEVNPSGYSSTTPDEVEVLIEGPSPIEVHFGDLRIG